MTARAQLIGIIVEHLGGEEGRVLDDVTFERMDADSLDMVELVMGIEEDFGLEITDAEAERFLTVTNTVGDAVAFINGKVSAKEGRAVEPEPVRDDRPTRDSFPRTNRVEGRNFID